MRRIVVVQLLSHVWQFSIPWTAACQASLSFTISQSLFKLMSIESSNQLILCRPFTSCPQSIPASGSFPMSWLFASGGQSIGISASASVLSMNIQGWFLLGLTGLISLQSKGLSRVFSSTIVQRHQFFSPQICSCPALTPIHDYWKNHNLDYMNLFPFRFRSFTHFSISLSAFLLLSCMSSLYILDIN